MKKVSEDQLKFFLGNKNIYERDKITDIGSLFSRNFNWTDHIPEELHISMINDT